MGYGAAILVLAGIAAAVAADYYLLDALVMVTAGKYLLEVLDWLAFWR